MARAGREFYRIFSATATANFILRFARATLGRTQPDPAHLFCAAGKIYRYVAEDDVDIPLPTPKVWKPEMQAQII